MGLEVQFGHRNSFLLLLLSHIVAYKLRMPGFLGWKFTANFDELDLLKEILDFPIAKSTLISPPCRIGFLHACNYRKMVISAHYQVDWPCPRLGLRSSKQVIESGDDNVVVKEAGCDDGGWPSFHFHRDCLELYIPCIWCLESIWHERS